MCVSCGNGNYDDDHGNPDSITAETIERAAIAAGVSPQQVAQNISAAFDHPPTEDPMTWPAGNPPR